LQVGDFIWTSGDCPIYSNCFEYVRECMAHVAANTLAYPCTSHPYDVRLAQERFPNFAFHPLREHAGLALQST
jgi:peptide chain release factor 3